MRVRSRVFEAFLVFLLTVALYLTFLSRHFDLNGVAEARALELGALFSANHLLYRPLGLLLQDLLSTFGFEMPAVFVLQILTAMCGAIGVAFAYLFYQRITDSRLGAAAIAFWLGTTWAYWAFSTDAMYIPMAAMFVTGALAIFTSGNGRTRVMITGFLAGFAILAWQANIFLIIVFPLGLFLFKPARYDKQLSLSFWFLVACFLPVGSMYWLAALSAGISTPERLFRWVTSHGSGVGLPMWGRVTWERVVQTGQIAINSVVPLESTLGVAAFAILLLAAAWKMKGDLLCPGWSKPSTIAWLMAGYAVYLPFIIWWDPATDWFVVPNIFLGALLALSFGAFKHRRYVGIVLVAAISMIATVNFSSTIWPRRTAPNHNFLLAECVASQMQPSDVVVVADWDWADYIPYFFSRSAISFIAAAASSGNPEAALSRVRQRISDTQTFKGNAYMRDTASYSDQHLVWFQEQTRIKLEELDEFKSAPAFECHGKMFWRVPRMPIQTTPISR